MNSGPLGGDTGDKSDSSDSGMGSASSPDCADPGPDAVCRDFLRHVCKRGRRCKYRHPAVDECQAMARDTEVVFCHDFQNSGCQRPACKFLHCSREEEEHFKATRQLPARLNTPTLSMELPPLCKDFLKGSCKRAAKCKFRHLSASELEEPQPTMTLCSFPEIPMPPPQQIELFEMAKRRRLEFDMEQSTALALASPLVPFAMDWGGRCEARLLADENAMLRRRLEELRKQCNDLLATNEVLLEQNARLRTGAHPQLPTSIMPACTLTMTAPSVLSFPQSVSTSCSSTPISSHAILTFAPSNQPPLSMG